MAGFLAKHPPVPLLAPPAPWITPPPAFFLLCLTYILIRPTLGNGRSPWGHLHAKAGYVSEPVGGRREGKLARSM